MQTVEIRNFCLFFIFVSLPILLNHVLECLKREPKGYVDILLKNLGFIFLYCIRLIHITAV